MPRERETGAESPFVHTHGQSGEYFDYGALCDLLVREEMERRRIETPLFAVDCENAVRLDDAIGVEREGRGFRVYSAISTVSRYTNFWMKRLPREFHMVLHRSREDCRMCGQQEALVLDFWADGEDVADAHIYLAAVDATAVTPPYLPEPMRSRFEHVTNAFPTEDNWEYTPAVAVSRIMRMHNILVANWALRKGIPIPLHNKDGEKKWFSLTPEGYKHQDRQLRWYSRSTNPLRERVDRVTDQQVIDFFFGGKTIMGERTLEQFCEYVNQNPSREYAA